VAALPGHAVYRLYLRKLRDVRPLGGVGRQSGLFLRHRKPRGSQATTLLCLLLALLAGALCFIAQSAVLFGLGSSHAAFFASLLWPPFADILALVSGVLFVCGAADGTVVCLFVVASNCNTALALGCRVLATDALRSIGLLYVLAEYAIAFSVKVAICRLVNLMIAHAEAEPALLEPSGHDADHEWVREYVLFHQASAEGLQQLGQLGGQAVAGSFTRLSSAEDVAAEALPGGEGRLSPTLGRPLPQCDGWGGASDAADTLRQVSAGSLSDSWTPLYSARDPFSPP